MRNIFVVVHPEASHHTDGLVGGWFDSGLTELGTRQAGAIARALADRLDGRKPEIFSSDLSRARRTAEVVAARANTSITTDPDLREKSFGEAEGKPKEWLRARSVPLPDVGERLRHDEGIPGAETRMQLAERCYRALARILESPVEDQIVVTHGGPVTLLIAAWIGMPIEAAGRVQFPCASGSITTLRKDPRNFSHQLVQLNDVGHLLQA
ncbi:histidine phosphatase family protein [Kribbella sp. CA-293567]|uniref:histidine phosphatase family protein n=1 Tax=Kribbella sp. CA-293567 TaxID=3002436 RepID=UPI0022DE4769|nr:histidine phosphatase family protein [Kribbella sp. CA-293567]WBQ02311.1 histidine phosphatase family protein [Kribbella sp. CA-293567]